MSDQSMDPRHAVLDAVRRGVATVTDLACELGVTDNAVRLHLVALERDGLVRREAVVRSGRPGQPAVRYGLTAEGEAALSRAYPRALAALAAALDARLDRRALRAAFAGAGARLAGGSTGSGDLARRAQACADAVRELGGAVTVEHAGGTATLVGQGCPLAAAVRESPAACTMIEALLARRFGLRVTQACTHGPQPACRFRLVLPG